MSTKSKPKATSVFISKLGTAKGVERSRIWIEGKRLVDAGFTVGAHFVKELATSDNSPADPGRPMLYLTLCNDRDVYTTMPCKVSGKGEKPIIDITGQMVAEVFGKLGTHVEVLYTKGLIRIVVPS